MLFFPVPSISLTRVTKHTDVYVVLLNVYVVLLNICKRCTVIDDARYKYPCQSWKNFTPSQGSHPDKNPQEYAASTVRQPASQDGFEPTFFFVPRQWERQLTGVNQHGRQQ